MRGGGGKWVSHYPPLGREMTSTTIMRDNEGHVMPRGTRERRGGTRRRCINDVALAWNLNPPPLDDSAAEALHDPPSPLWHSSSLPPNSRHHLPADHIGSSPPGSKSRPAPSPSVSISHPQHVLLARSRLFSFFLFFLLLRKNGRTTGHHRRHPAPFLRSTIRVEA